MPYRRKIILAALAFAAIGVGIIVITPPKNEELPELFTTANPLNLDQIRAISKYRSCEGHDYRGPNLAGETEKTPRSMKHYLMVKPEFRGTEGQVEVFAPFDGEIAEVRDEMASSGRQVWLTPNPNSSSRWQFVFFHVLLNSGLKEGSAVIAGQRIGTVSLARGPDGATDNFDFALKLIRPFRQPALDTPFKHMAPEVLAEYRQRGASIDKLIVSKKERDGNPCSVSSSSDGGKLDAIFVSKTTADEYVWLTSTNLIKRDE